jgi:erythromycin esterase
MKPRRHSIIAMLLAMAAVLACFAGCAGSGEALDQTALLADITELTVGENVRIVGLGEASHGTSEFQRLKGDVFKALVANNGCRVFAIEGDFGGCAAVNDYIHGGAGTAEEAVAKIGFRIYRTQEMADIVQWMRTYNETAPEGEDLKFYGFDAQRFDNNKAALLTYLEENLPALAGEPFEKLAALTDAAMYTLDASVLSQAEADITALMSAMEEQKPVGMDAAQQLAYDRAYECAQSILENTQLCGESAGYSQMRDTIMARKVGWLAEHEDGLIYINGHNGHISRQSVSGYTSMGERLTTAYGEEYFPIATDAANTVFNASDGGEYKEFTVRNGNAFTDQLDFFVESQYYLAFADVNQDAAWQEVLQAPQVMTALNVEFTSFQKLLRQFYTLTFTPSAAFAGVIVLKETSSTELI